MLDNKAASKIFPTSIQPFYSDDSTRANTELELSPCPTSTFQFEHRGPAVLH
jgi:hypothetical protein